MVHSKYRNILIFTLLLIPLLVLSRLSYASYAFEDFGVSRNTGGPVVSDFPGERYNLLTGQLSFQYRDVDIPLNGTSLTLDRKFDNVSSFGIADYYSLQIGMGFHFNLDIPRILVGKIGDLIPGNFGEACFGANFISLALSGQIINRSRGYYNETWLPDDYESKDIAFDGGSVYDCSKKTLRMPNGQSIVFEKSSKVHSVALHWDMYYPSKITDRFGNEINFVYEEGFTSVGGAIVQLVLTQVTSNDGVVVNLDYEKMDRTEFKKIDKITYGKDDQARTIDYNYHPGRDLLSEVIDPEGRVASYKWRGDTGIEGNDGRSVTYANIAEVKTPSGAKIVYDYLNGYGDDDPAYCIDKMRCSLLSTVSKKTVTGANIEPLHVAYSRMHLEPHYSRPDERIVEVLEYRSNAPISILKYKTDEVLDWWHTPIPSDEGLAQKLAVYKFEQQPDEGDNLGYLLNGKVANYSLYEGIAGDTGTGHSFHSTNYYRKYNKRTLWETSGLNHEAGCKSIQNILNSSIAKKRCGYVSKKEVEQTYDEDFYEGGGRTRFKRTTNGIDSYGRAIEEFHSMYLNYDRVMGKGVRYLRRKDKKNWILTSMAGKQHRTEKLQLKTFYEQNHYPSTHENSPSLPSTVYEHDLLKYTNTEYHDNGRLKKRVINDSDNYELYENYKRGTPQTVKTKNRYNSALVDSMTKVVDYFGNVRSETDFEGNTISYEYDKLNRLTKIDYASASWADISYDYFLENGLEVKKKTHGNLVSYEYYNARGQVHKTNINGVYQDLTYTSEGLLKTKTLPYYSVNTSPEIITYGYDALNRKTSESLSNGGYSRAWKYLAPGKVKYTDGYGSETTTSYRMFSNLNYSLPILIESPENISTIIEYDRFDNVTSVKQGNVTEGFVEKTYEYNQNKLLCRTDRPETGTTRYGYNARGQHEWTATGLSVSEAGCSGAVADNAKVSFTYDNRGDIHQAKLAGTAYRTTTLDKVGNIDSLVTPAGTWSFMYNDRNFLDLETFEIDGSSYSLDWNYNSQGSVSSLTYPSNMSVAFSPDPLGRPTQVGSYISSVNYSAGGNLTTLNYGNGIARSYADNDFGLPELINYTPSSGTPVTRSYLYDDELNWSSISRVPSGMTGNDYISNIQYDGLQRIKSANNALYNVQHSFDYDVTNNIEFISDGRESRDLHYDSKNRLSSYDYVNSADVSSTFSLAYDARGNITNDGTNSYRYNLLNEMTQGGGWNFSYDGNGHLVKKNKGEEAIYSIYSQSGMLMHQKVGDVKTDFMYVGDTLVAKEMKK